jgi:hypothetical protein
MSVGSISVREGRAFPSNDDDGGANAAANRFLAGRLRAAGALELASPFLLVPAGFELGGSGGEGVGGGFGCADEGTLLTVEEESCLEGGRRGTGTRLEWATASDLAGGALPFTNDSEANADDELGRLFLLPAVELDCETELADPVQEDRGTGLWV